jgi:hypothetical protein
MVFRIGSRDQRLADKPGDRYPAGVNLTAAKWFCSTALANSSSVGTRRSRNFIPIIRCARSAPYDSAQRR